MEIEQVLNQDIPLPSREAVRADAALQHSAPMKWAGSPLLKKGW
jgi:hypothetical protein